MVKGLYVYSADRERLVRTEGGRATLYLPGGTEVTASGSVLSAQRYYQFGGQTVAVRTGGGSSGTTTVVADHHGTGVVQVAQATNVLSRRYTDPYGQARGAAASWTGDRGFLDKTTDATGLVQVGARYYDPLIGRFVSVDPVMDLSDPQQWNAYSYSNNNPLTWSDPSGMIPIGAGHVGYNPRQKNDKRKYDTCTHATSCIKTENRGGTPVRVRYNYTENARTFFSKPKWRDTSYTVNRTEKYYAASRAAAKAAGAARAAAAAERKAVERERAAERTRAEERGNWLTRWANNSSDWWGGQNVSLAAGLLAVGVGVLSIGLVATGVGAPIGLAIGGVALGLVGTVIDCTAAVDASCAVSAAGTAVGFGGLGAAAKAARLGWSAAIPSQNSAVADNVANIGVTLDMTSAFTGTVGAGATGVTRGMGWDW